MMRVGFIGLGSIGKPMALNLARAGHYVTVHDIEVSRANDLLSAGAHWADSPAQHSFDVGGSIYLVAGTAANCQRHRRKQWRHRWVRTGQCLG